MILLSSGILAFRGWRQDNEEFKVTVSYTPSSRTTWTTRDSPSKKKKKETTVLERWIWRYTSLILTPEKPRWEDQQTQDGLLDSTEKHSLKDLVASQFDTWTLRVLLPSVIKQDLLSLHSQGQADSEMFHAQDVPLWVGGWPVHQEGNLW